MKVQHSVSVDYKESFRTAKVASLFDLPVQEKLSRQWAFDFPIDEKPWKLGLIVGSSGSGKTTLAKHIFGDDAYHTGFKWGKTSIIDSFADGLSIEKITEVLSKVGFSSPPAWLLPFDKLSNGQKFRAEIARILLSKKELTIIDEFTSVIDRTVAKIGCAAISKYAKAQENKIVAVSCHYDIVEWLEPDWVFDVNTLEFTWGNLRRPQLNFTVYKVHRAAWELFKEHHYLSNSILRSAQCFVLFLDDIEPVAFSSYINFCHPQRKDIQREHRTVVLPDYQGIGLGTLLSDFVADKVSREGYSYISSTSHPAFIKKRRTSKNWKLERIGINTRNLSKKSKLKLKETSFGRRTASFKYIGHLHDQ